MCVCSAETAETRANIDYIIRIAPAPTGYPAAASVATSRESTPRVRRAVITIDAVRRQRLLRVLDYIELRHPSIDPEMYDIDLSVVTALKALFTTDDQDEQISIAFVYEDLFALRIIIYAAETYSTRYGGGGIYGVSPSELDDLRRWVASSERWFITPLKLKLKHE